MSSFYGAKSLMGGYDNMLKTTHGLVGEINVKYPGRDHASDGWIGDPSHAARKSEHNPCWTCRPPLTGIVLAVDIDSNGAPGIVTPVVHDVLEAAIGDPRVYYVIWNRRIASRTYGWVWKYYGGSNPHDHHVHVSLLTGSSANDTSPWLEAPPFKVQPLAVSISRVREQFQIAAGIKPGKVVENNGVGRLQHVMVHSWGAKLDVDGIVGPRTMGVWAGFERRRPEHALGDPRVPDRKSLALASKGRFRLVA